MSKNPILNVQAASILSNQVAQSVSFEEMSGFQERYEAVVMEYQNTPSLRILSTVKLQKLASTRKWVEELRANKHCVPLLVANMLKGDFFALNIYENVYEGQLDLLVGYSKIHQYPALDLRFRNYGGAEDARAKITAEHWLTSSEAVDVFNDEAGNIALCGAVQTLGMRNEYLDCS